jgi:sulfoxide reductase heme-binding subunit YedZ
MPAWAKPSLFVLGLCPFGALVWAGLANELGPDPAEVLMHETGKWGARILILTLCVSPFRAWLGWPALIQLRRMLGLFTFFYASTHLLLFLQFYLGWSGDQLLEELVERPYITVGFLAWTIMLLLALTSNRRMQRRLRRNWQRLHRGIYVVAILVCLHFLWQVRSDFGEALVYVLLFAALLGWRLLRFRKKQGSGSNAKILDASS